jgi:hypothetical protein
MEVVPTPQWPGEVMWKHTRLMWIHLAPLKRAPTAQVGQTGLLSSSSITTIIRSFGLLQTESASKRSVHIIYNSILQVKELVQNRHLKSWVQNDLFMDASASIPLCASSNKQGSRFLGSSTHNLLPVVMSLNKYPWERWRYTRNARSPRSSRLF